MKKLNNKGFTIVELVVTFALLMIIVVGLLEVVLEAKSDTSYKKYAKEMTEFKGIVVKTIQDDLIKNKAQSASVSCATPTSSCAAEITFNDGTKKALNVYPKSKSISYDGIAYEIPNKSDVEFRSTNPISITLNNNILVIDIPYFKKNINKNNAIEDTVNYGIKIIHQLQ